MKEPRIDLGGWVLGFGLVFEAIAIPLGIKVINDIRERHVTPTLELSDKPDEVVFHTASNDKIRIQKGIIAAIDVCKFKNAAAEAEGDGKSTVRVECEAGTLMTGSDIVPRNAQQGR